MEKDQKISAPQTGKVPEPSDEYYRLLKRIEEKIETLSEEVDKLNKKHQPVI